MQITNKSWLRKDFGQSSIQLLSSFCISHSSIHPSIQLYLMAGDAFIQGRPGPGQWDLPLSVFVWCVKYCIKYCIKCIVRWDIPSLGATIWSLFLLTFHHSRITAMLYSDHSIGGSGFVRITQMNRYRVLVLNCEIWALGLSLTAIGVKSDLKSILADTSKTLPFTNLSWVITKKGHWRWFTLMFCFAEIEYKLQRGIHRSLFCYG